MQWRRKWQPNPVFLPGESQGQRSLVGCRLWGRTESDTTKVMQQQQDVKMAAVSRGHRSPHTVGCHSKTLLHTCKLPLSIKPLMSLLPTPGCFFGLQADNHRACRPARCSQTIGKAAGRLRRLPRVPRRWEVRTGKLWGPDS